MYSDDIPFGVTRFDSIQRDSQWRHRIDKEEGIANMSKRLYRNPITGTGFAKTKSRKPRAREENRILTNNYGEKKVNNVNYNESKISCGEEMKAGSSYGSNTSRSVNSVRRANNKNNNYKAGDKDNNVGGMVPKIPIQQLTKANLRKQLTNEQRNRLKNHRLAKSMKSSNNNNNTARYSQASSSLKKSTSRSNNQNKNNVTSRSRIASSRIASSRVSSGISSCRSGNTDVILDRILRLEQVLEEESEKRRRAEDELEKIKNGLV